MYGLLVVGHGALIPNRVGPQQMSSGQFLEGFQWLHVRTILRGLDVPVITTDLGLERVILKVKSGWKQNFKLQDFVWQ